MAYTWLGLLGDALVENGAYGPEDIQEGIAPADMQLVARIADALIDEWAGLARYAYAHTFSLFTLQPNLSPHTIGPTGTFETTLRPMRIRSGAIVLTDSTPATDQPMQPRDAAWWARQRVKGTTSNIPTDFYYERDFPNGSIFFWPVPTYAYQVRLELEVALAGLPVDGNGNYALGRSFTAPPIYRKALKLTVAEESAEALSRPVSPRLVQRAAAARANLTGANTSSAKLATADYGMGGRARRGFNWGTGLPND